MNIDIKINFYTSWIMFVELRVKIIQIIVHVNVGDSHTDCRWSSCSLRDPGIITDDLCVYTGYTP